MSPKNGVCKTPENYYGVGTTDILGRKRGRPKKSRKEGIT